MAISIQKMQGAIRVLSVKASLPASLFAVEAHDECIDECIHGLHDYLESLPGFGMIRCKFQDLLEMLLSLVHVVLVIQTESSYVQGIGISLVF